MGAAKKDAETAEVEAPAEPEADVVEAPAETEPETEAPVQHVVKASLVQAKVGNRVLHFYRGDILPGGIASETVEHLLSLGLIAVAD